MDLCTLDSDPCPGVGLAVQQRLCNELDLRQEFSSVSTSVKDVSTSWNSSNR